MAHLKNEVNFLEPKYIKWISMGCLFWCTDKCQHTSFKR